MYSTSFSKDYSGLDAHLLSDISLRVLSVVTDRRKYNFLFKINICLKDPSQPQPFSMPSKLLMLHGEVIDLLKVVFLEVCCSSTVVSSLFDAL